ncbi:hypothetical protein DL764_001559 [Monosporascus ibericus]|uniref:Aminoglycoside phosphotransferase domain-containing protein n=1 Tax=Monosporascus ibericus TaxID=155417 RepID=A0A4Q4TQJ6_9PEZI|nr:hypothetical protein DL764_001559 [Monosporascus ibericus]
MTTTNVELLAIYDGNFRDAPISVGSQLMESLSSTILVNPELLPEGWQFEEVLPVALPPFPLGDLNLGRSGQPVFVHTELSSFPELSNVWHPTRIDYFDLTSAAKDRKAHHTKDYCSDAKEKLRLVTHPPFELPALMKTVLDGKGIAPRFLGHVTEAGRVVGFLLEWIEGVRPADVSDLGTCIGVLQRLHDILGRDPYYDYDYDSEDEGAHEWDPFGLSKLVLDNY